VWNSDTRRGRFFFAIDIGNKDKKKSLFIFRILSETTTELLVLAIVLFLFSAENAFDTRKPIENFLYILKFK